MPAPATTDAPKAPTTDAPKALRTAIAIGAVYAVFGFAWILLSDAVVEAIAPGPAWLQTAQRYKGLCYVVVTTIGLVLLTRAGFRMLFAAHDQTQSRELQVQDLFLRHPQPMWLFDRGTLRFLRVNEAAIRQYGYSEREFLAMTLNDIRPPEDVPHLAEALRRRHQDPRANEPVRHRKADGQVIHVDITTHEVAYEDRKATLVLALDVTAEVLTRHALVRQEAQFRQLHQSLGEVLWLRDARSDALLYLSPAFVVIYGRSPAEFAADEGLWLRVVHPDDRATAQASHALLQRDGHADCEYRIVRPDGTIRWIADRKKLIVDDEGLVRMIGGIAEDITAQKQRDQAWAAMQAELERRVADRTARLEAARRELATLNDELARRVEQAESATRAKSAFLANMSHEIRTPMNAIVGLTRLMARDAREPRQRDRLGRIDESAMHLLQVINDILDLSKIEAGKMALADVDFSLGQVLSQAIGIVGGSARDKSLDLALEADGLPDRLRGDPKRLLQALLNLLSNAVKFTDRGRVRLHVERLADAADPTDAAGDPAGAAGGSAAALRFSVSDTGVGLSPAQRERLFHPFQQADETLTRRHGGTGLGLALTRHLALLMGGEVGVRSEPGIGSTFWFTARFAPASGVDGVGVPAAEVADADELEARLRAGHSDQRVLLAEDNPVNRLVAVELLRSLGLVVATADDGEQAVALALAEPFDLILMDVQMPVLDGLAAARAIRAAGLGSVPIVAMTAHAFNEDRALCLAAGMNDHLVKPVDPQQLHAALLRWLPRRLALQDGASA